MSHTAHVLDREALDFYIEILNLLKEKNVSFLVGGAYALHQHTGIERHTKDLDLFVRKKEAQHVLDVLEEAGYKSEMTFPHWLGKAFKGDHFIDVIFSSGNAIADVDDAWFTHAKEGTVFGVDVLLCPPEEMIWSKGFIMERERFDGADVAHIIQARSEDLDWNRLLYRFGENWRILLTHLIMFGFIYPDEKAKIPANIMNQLLYKMTHEVDPNGKQHGNEHTNGNGKGNGHSTSHGNGHEVSHGDKSTDSGSHRVIKAGEPHVENVCRGPLLSREQYLIDINKRGYVDARQEPVGKMKESDIKHWTLAIDSK